MCIYCFISHELFGSRNLFTNQYSRVFFVAFAQVRNPKIHGSSDICSASESFFDVFTNSCNFFPQVLDGLAGFGVALHFSAEFFG